MGWGGVGWGGKFEVEGEKEGGGASLGWRGKMREVWGWRGKGKGGQVERWRRKRKEMWGWRGKERGEGVEGGRKGSGGGRGKEGGCRRGELHTHTLG